MNINTADIAPCLPLAPTPTLIRLALAPHQQLDLALSLIHGTFNPAQGTSLNEDHRLWCMRLSRAIPTDMLVTSHDPLHMLRNWVDSAIWHRLRLRFPYERVVEAEKKILLEKRCSRFDTLWQAFIWRATSLENDTTDYDSNVQGGY
ncbi:type III secretion protein [Pseudomonas sp. P7759]|uniref:type III secretion protein n=1 Tax=Pseudomonas sp. P7759 TaxID=2738831 RepID=UPI00210B3C64|nr:type III secretion protein [Pseudomonas sp. P7759]